MKRILFVAQTPPPYLGQSIMHKFLIEADWSKVEKKHIRLELSRNSGQFGIFSLRKILAVLNVIIKIWIERIKGKVDLLYYPPSGPVTRKTFYKDISLLLFTRFLSNKIVFHFHADHFDELLNKLNRVELMFAHLIYRKPDLCIVILEPQIQDVAWLHPKKIEVIPNGIEDKWVGKDVQTPNSHFSILYVGLLVGYKGIETAIYASKILKEEGFNFKWTFVGGWSSPKYESEIYDLILKYDLKEYIIFAGEKIEGEKWKYFEEADLLCLPTETDLMPLCIIEGMMMSLPIVTTRLRTIRCIIDEKINGMLSQPKNYQELASNIMYLYQNRDVSIKMGINGRKKYEQNYSIERHLELMQNAIYNLLKD